MKKLAMFAIAVAALMSVSTGAQAATYTGAANDWAPFADKSHPKQGVVVELVSAALKTQGSELKFTTMPWNRAVDKVKKGEIDLIPTMWYNEERTKDFAYSDYILKNQIKMIKKKGDAFEYAGLSSLKGKTVGIIRGYTYPKDFMSDKSFTREPAKDLEANYKKVVAGRIDLTLEDELVAKAMLFKEDPKFMDKIDFVTNPVSTNELFLTCGKVNPKCTTIIETFNKGLAEIKANGTYKKIMASYGM